jgi:hypothetical protein
VVMIGTLLDDLLPGSCISSEGGWRLMVGMPTKGTRARPPRWRVALVPVWLILPRTLGKDSLDCGTGSRFPCNSFSLFALCRRPHIKYAIESPK